jgi:hypothetical protein
MKIRNYLLSGCLIAALCSCGTSQKGDLNLTLSKDTLFDKVKGAGPDKSWDVPMAVQQSFSICQP